jgi:hypothetical protein
MISSWQQLSDKYRNSNIYTDNLVNDQQTYLFDCLKRNRGTEFGRAYQFDRIQTVDDYRSRVPLQDYVDLAESIQRIAGGESDILFTGNAIAFERTSGSSDGQKLIPYSAASLNDFRTAIVPWLAQLVRQYQLSDGHAYWALSPATRQAEMTAGGIPIGMPDAAYLGEDLIPFFLNVSALPLWVGTLSDIQDWQLATLYYLLTCQDLVLISVWSPTFLIVLMAALEARKAELLTVLEHGTELKGETLAAQPASAKRLEAYLQTKNTRQLWPHLKLISCWADASSQPYYQELQQMFPHVAIQPKGLLLTEGVVSVPDQHNQTLLTSQSGFYEFLDANMDSRLAHELVEGQSYEVVMTTAGGLYRYRTYDKVVCAGYSQGLPILRFTGRSNLTSDLVGEKLTDDFVRQCLSGIQGFRMLLPNSSGKPGYSLVLDNNTDNNVEEIISAVEQRLCNNPHYAYARKLGQLQSLNALAIQNPLQLYLASAIHFNTCLGDIKVPSLCTKPGVFAAQTGAAA